MVVEATLNNSRLHYQNKSSSDETGVCKSSFSANIHFITKFKKKLPRNPLRDVTTAAADVVVAYK